jgi:hypothetical protein
MASKPKASLLQQAKLIRSKNHLSWETLLDPAVRAEVDELLQAKLSGELSLSFRQMSELLANNGITVTKNGLQGAIERLKRE